MQIPTYISIMIISRLISRVVGAVIVFACLVLVSNPEILSGNPVPADTFDAVERRMW